MSTFPRENLPLLQPYDIFALLDPGGRVFQQSTNISATALSDIYRIWGKEKNPGVPIIYSLSRDHNGIKQEDFLFMVSLLEAREDFGATLILGSPLDPGRQLPRLGLTLGLVFCLTVFVAFGGGYWLASQAMHPVQIITHTARDIGEYDLNRRLQLDRNDELGQLAHTFDEMLNRLQAAFERQRQFTADASHELRTPLAIIEIETERSLERRRTPDEYEAALKIIHTENERMSRLVNELLTLARLDSGRIKMQNEKLDLSELALDILERLAVLASKKGVALLAGEMDEAFVWADSVYLIHLITNLVENGLKYAQGENAQVVVQTGSILRAGKMWSWLQVADNGPGIPEEHLSHLFERFYRVDAARTQIDVQKGEQSNSGSGLGLAIVHSIMQALGGEVEVYNQVNGGAVFTVWLPATA